MGTVVQFQFRPEEAVARTEAILNRIGLHYQQQLKAKEELPRLLARLIGIGKREEALMAVSLWGSGTKEAHEVLAMCQEWMTTSADLLVATPPAP